MINIFEKDIKEYEELCILYDIEVQHKQDAFGKWIVDCYCPQALNLKEQHLDNMYSNKLINI